MCGSYMSKHLKEYSTVVIKKEFWLRKAFNFFKNVYCHVVVSMLFDDSEGYMHILSMTVESMIHGYQANYSLKVNWISYNTAISISLP